ncbi:hypothetical protein GCM10010330_14320 [Streptomyces tendae]|nr:hypothetical protein GCM10010330_14320 [Streptomyces tendae]
MKTRSMPLCSRPERLAYLGGLAVMGVALVFLLGTVVAVVVAMLCVGMAAEGGALASGQSVRGRGSGPVPGCRWVWSVSRRVWRDSLSPA